MAIIFRLAGNHINRRFLQSLFFVLGVALGVAMIIAIDVANTSAKRAFTLSSESISGRATHQIHGGPGGVPTSLYQTLRTDLGLRESAPVLVETIRAPALDDLPLRILGVDPFAEAPFRDYLSAVNVDNDNTTDNAFQSLSTFIVTPNSVLISTQLAEQYNLERGQTLTLQTTQDTVDVTIVGLLQASDSASEEAINDLILADIATVQEILDEPETLTRIDLILPAENTAEWISSIESILPAGTVLAATSEEDDTLTQMTAAFELNLQALSLLALVVGVFLIYNTVTFSVVQRRPVIGILRSLGTTRRQIFLLILGEALILGSVGTVMGLGLGIILGRGAVFFVAQTISDLYFTVNVQRIDVTSFTLIKGAVIGIAASVGTAIIPAISATRTPPTGAMRRSDQENTTRRLIPLYTLAGVLFNGLGLLLLNLPTRSIEVSFAALFLIVAGSALFTPLALVAVMTVLSPITSALFGVIGRMAPRAVVRSLSRTSVAVAALTIAVSVTVGISVMIASFRSTVDNWLQTTLGSDIYISPPLLTTNLAAVDVDPDVRQIILETPGIDGISATRTVSVTAPDYPDMPPVNLQAIDSDIAVERGFAWNDAPNGDYWAAMQTGAVLVSEPFAYRREIKQDENPSITLITDDGPHTFPVVGVYYDYSTDQGKVLFAESLYRQFYDDAYISSVAAYMAPNAEMDTVIANLRHALAGYDLEVQANRELRSGVFEVFDNAFSITVALRLLATLVAFIGILAALLALQLENTRQYGVMRANGMTPRQLTRFTLLQTSLMGIVSGLLALPIGLALALVLLYVINVRSFGWTMDFYFVPQEFIEAFFVAVMAAVFAGLYPAWRLSRLATARALRSE